MRHLPDALILAGLLMAATGLWWIYPPLAMLAGGAGLCALGWAASGPKASR